jgi:hypothetical protein
VRYGAAAITLTLVVVAGCGGSAERDGDGRVRTTEAGTQIIGATDPKTGLHFEVQTSATFGDSSVRVSTTKATPARVRQDLDGEQLALSCRVRGAKARYFPSRWDDLDEPFGTALLVDGDISSAERVSTCMLVRGKPGPSTTSFSTDPEDAYSLVTFRPSG